MDLIDRQSLIKNLNTFAPECYNSLINSLIKKEPSIEATLVIRGKWIEVNKEAYCGMKCNLCNSRIRYTEYYNGNHKYCHKCGAKMDLK